MKPEDAWLGDTQDERPYLPNDLHKASSYVSLHTPAGGNPAGTAAGPESEQAHARAMSGLCGTGASLIGGPQQDTPSRSGCKEMASDTTTHDLLIRVFIFDSSII